MCKLSVIVPFYKVEDYLAECLDSIFAVDIPDLEVIAVNDGSPDGCLDIAKAYAANHPNMIIVDQENQGLSAARNNGFAKASGEYVCWIDSDDYYEPGALEAALKICEENDLDFLASAFGQFGGEYVKVQELDDSTTDVMDGRQFLSYVKENSYHFAWAWQYIYKREFLLESNLKFIDGVLYEAAPFLLKSFAKAKRTMYNNSKLIHYRIREGSIVRTDVSPKQVYSLIQTLPIMMDIAEDADVEPEYTEYFGSLVATRLAFCADSARKISDDELAEVLDLCTNRERMHFRTFVVPLMKRMNRIAKLKEDKQALKDKKAELISANKSLREKNIDLREKNVKLRERNKALAGKLKRIRNSRSYKLGRILSKPLRMLSGK